MVAESFLTSLVPTGPSGGPGTSRTVTLQVALSVPLIFSASFLSYNYVLLSNKFQKPENVNWGSASEGYKYLTARKHMLSLNAVVNHVKNFRPTYLVLCGESGVRPELIAFANCFQKSKGMSVYANISMQKLHEYHVLADDDEDLKESEGGTSKKHNERATVEAEMLKVN